MAAEVQRLEASGTAVFVPDDAYVWLPATVSSVHDDNTISYSLDHLEPSLASEAGARAQASMDDAAAESGERKLDLSTLKPSLTSSGRDDSLGRFMGKLPLQDAGLSSSSGASDMATLSSLNEPSILYNLRRRFFAAIPYTYTADIVIAVNPYQWLHHLYTEDLRKEYLIFGHRTGQGSADTLPPHVYSTSSRAFHGMKDFHRNQAILVSGESGAGKTETVKILMGHLAFIAASDDDQTVIRRVLESNPLLESFGNAKTVRNDNSSRFGKYIELQFAGHKAPGTPGSLGGHSSSPKHSLDESANAFLVGSCSRHYLLEKSRVVSQSTGERNFHIFYQLLAAPSIVNEPVYMRASDGAELGPLDFAFTAGGGEESITTKIEGLTDAARSDATVRALELIGLTSNDRKEVWEVLAGIFHLGQLKFATPGGDADEGAELVPDELAGRTAPSLASAGHMLGCFINEADSGCKESLGTLAKALVERTMTTVSETVKIKQTPAQAEEGRNALAKELYSRLFDWLVQRINDSTMVKETNRVVQGEEHDIIRTIGLLDIFGFESFKKNRFEQLCINYANEKLQQKFTQDVFKSVQAEYEEEGIAWEHIAFAENQPVLDLIESRMGVISILNEECVRPRGSNTAFCSKLITTHRSHPHFITSKFNTSNAVEFGVRHYAGAVVYHVEGFLEKNKDTLVGDLSNLMSTSSNSLAKFLFTAANDNAEETRKSGGAKQNRRGSSITAATVATKFKRQLTSLMGAIEKTSVQYVRCVKPNALKSKNAFNLAMVTEQLRCAGVLEAIRISRAAYPNRVLHAEVLSRFGRLALLSSSYVLPGDQCDNEDDDVLGGHSRSTAQVSQVLRALLHSSETSDTECLYQVGKTRVYFQAGVLEGLEEQRQRIIQEYVLQVQTAFRRYVPYRKYKAKKRIAAIVGSCLRARCQRTKYLSVLNRVIRAQAFVRRIAAVQHFKKIRLDFAGIKLQSWYRGTVERWTQSKQRAAAIRIQAVLGRGPPARVKFLKDIEAHREHAKMENQLSNLKKQLEAEKAAREAQERADAEKQREREEQLRRHREEQTQMLQKEVAELQEELKEKSAIAIRVAALESETVQLKAELEAEKKAAKDAATVAEQRAQTLAATATANANAQAAAAAAAATAASVPREVAESLRTETEVLRARVLELEDQLVEKQASSPKINVMSQDALMDANDSDDDATAAAEEEERNRARIAEEIDRVRHEEQMIAEAKIAKAVTEVTTASSTEKFEFEEKLRKSTDERIELEKSARVAAENKLTALEVSQRQNMEEISLLQKKMKAEIKRAVAEREMLQRDLEARTHEVRILETELSKEKEMGANNLQKLMEHTEKLKLERDRSSKEKAFLESENMRLKNQAEENAKQLERLQDYKEYMKTQRQHEDVVPRQLGTPALKEIASPAGSLGKEVIKEAMSGGKDKQPVARFQSRQRPPSPRDSGVDSASLITTSPTFPFNGSSKVLATLNSFWEKVAFDNLAQTLGFSNSSSNIGQVAEVHICSGKDYLIVDKDQTYVKWCPCSDKGGYPQSAAFRLHPVGLAQKGRRSPPQAHGSDGSSFDFTLSTAVFKDIPKYVSIGGIFDGFCLSLTEKAHEAAIFRFVPAPRARAATPSAADSERALLEKSGFLSPMLTPTSSDAGISDLTSMDENNFLFSILATTKRSWVHLRTDGFVDVTGGGTSDMSTSVSAKSLAVFSLEYLKPREFYEMTLHEEQLGLLVSKDLPLRILGFTAVIGSHGAARTGEAERSGRVHVNDVIMSADGHDLTVKSRKESIQIIMRKRPVMLGFRVGSNAGGRSPIGVGSGNSSSIVTPSTLNKPLRRDSANFHSTNASNPSNSLASFSNFSPTLSASPAQWCREQYQTPEAASMSNGSQPKQYTTPPIPPQGGTGLSGGPLVVLGASPLMAEPVVRNLAGGLGQKSSILSFSKSASGFENIRLEAAQQYFSPAQLDQLRNVRDSIKRHSPGTFNQLVANWSTNQGKCVSLIEELIRLQYSSIQPLFISNKESVVTILLANH